MDVMGLAEKRLSEKLPHEVQTKLDEECQKIVDALSETSKEFKALVDKLEKAGKPWRVTCQCCRGTLQEKVGGVNIKGVRYDSDKNLITVCSDKASGVTPMGEIDDEDKYKDSITNTAIHEMVHSIQLSGLNTGLPNLEKGSCRECICHEIQARANEPRFSGKLNVRATEVSITGGAVNSCIQFDPEDPTGMKRVGRCGNFTTQEMQLLAKNDYKLCAVKIPLGEK